MPHPVDLLLSIKSIFKNILVKATSLVFRQMFSWYEPTRIDDDDINKKYRLHFYYTVFTIVLLPSEKHEQNDIGWYIVLVYNKIIP